MIVFVIVFEPGPRDGLGSAAAGPPAAGAAAAPVPRDRQPEGRARAAYIKTMRIKKCMVTANEKSTPSVQFPSGIQKMLEMYLKTQKRFKIVFESLKTILKCI